MYSKKIAMLLMSFLTYLLISGCTDFYTEQYRPDQILNDIRVRDEKRRQEDIEYFAPAIYDALDYVHEHSTEQMKQYISRGELLIGMNQKEVIASLHATGFEYGIPVRMNKYTSAYGDFETWEIGSIVPVYLLDFTDYILTGIYNP